MALIPDTPGIYLVQEDSEFARPIGQIIAPIIDRVIDAALAYQACEKQEEEA